MNIVENDIAVVTSIALDHMEYLGDHRDAIAYEKASIARIGKVLISGEENPPVTLSQTVAEKKAKLIQINRDFFYEEKNQNMIVTTSDGIVHRLPKPHLKSQNIATAIEVIAHLKNKLPVSEKNQIDGIQNTVWPGRFEVKNKPFPCVLDVAHNPHAARWLAKQYEQLPAVNNTIAIVGMLKDKAMIDTIAELVRCVDTWYICSLVSESEERGSDGREMLAFLQSQGVKNGYLFDSVERAMGSLLHAPDQRVLIFGSFYTVAAAKKIMGE